MKTSKLIIFNLISFAISVNTAYLYSINFSTFSISGYLFGILSILAFYMSSLFISISYVAQKAITKKNLLRLSLLIITIFLIISIISRIKEIIAGIFCYPCFINTIALIVLFSINLSILCDLKKLVNKLFLKK